jgi:hypothetical protein
MSAPSVRCEPCVRDASEHESQKVLAQSIGPFA